MRGNEPVVLRDSVRRRDIPLVEAGVMHVCLSTAAQDLVDLGSDRADIHDLDAVGIDARVGQQATEDLDRGSERRRRTAARGHDSDRSIGRKR